jgi:hypothetical protein
MTSKSIVQSLSLITAIAFAGTAHAAVINVGDPAAGTQAADRISTSTTWTANNTYNLTDQIYVENGATLTIEAGTVIASVATVDGSGALAIARGSKIIAIGTEADPIIFTSSADVATWANLAGHPTGKNPDTGTWRVAANEWGNLTIMGAAFISQNCAANPNFGNPSAVTCSVDNEAVMEGLDTGPVTLRRYGGNADNDDSGTLKYVSIRYAGRVVGLGNELNGLSMGGVGRATDIDHIEIMNNVDDGIEIWGGTVNVKNFSIWNVGDDSLDIDQGWRGKAPFGLIVQGYSLGAAQGSGVGDNCLEMDGAETADAQPVTTATLYNLTVIGQPISGDEGTAWRDNARVQIRNSIFMNIGEQLIEEGLADNCSANQGYGFGGTFTFAQTWATAYTGSTAAAGNPNLCNNAAARYVAQSQGNAAIGQGFLSEMTDSVFYQNSANAYNNANEGSDFLGVTVAGGSAPAKGNIVATSLPIASITRGPQVNPSGSLQMLPVISIDPRAANNATSSNASAPNDGFFTPASYRGAFSASSNWLCGWTAASAFGFIAGGSCNAPCAADTNGDSNVNVTDLLAVIGAWGACAGCPADTNNDGQVNVTDLLAVIGAWGACP